MAREGMDVDVISNDGTQMKDVGATAIPSVIHSIEGIVTQMRGTWHGPDAEAFVNAWNSTFKPNLTKIAGEVQTHGELAVKNASEQRDASTGGSIV
jgi:uncharacterized protein YukE